VIGHLLPQTVASDGAIIPGGYNMLVTMHATVMVFFVVMPFLIGTFGNFLIPLQIGAGDMAFPLLNEVSYWLYFLSGVFLLSAFFVPGGAPGTGWTAYAPLSAVGAYNGTQMGQSLWGVAIFVNGLSSIAGATNYITTVVNMRCPGMSMFRMPLSVWALFVTAILLLLAVPVLSAAAAMLFCDLNAGTSFFRPVGGGQPLLWRPLFWFSAAEVYILILPAMGLTSDIIAVFHANRFSATRRWSMRSLPSRFWFHRLGPSYVAAADLTLSARRSPFTMFIAVPSAIKFNWLGTVGVGP
jgi:cytochrome c oxidase subunit 1